MSSATIAPAARMSRPDEAATQKVISMRNNIDANPNTTKNKAIRSNRGNVNSNSNTMGGEPHYFVNHDLNVEKSIVNELLLVCGVIGSTVDPNTQQMIPVEDCLNWLQDLQRALRRDDDAHRPISLLLGKWKVLQQKLLPLVLSCRYDTPLVMTIVKILVILTKPLSENAKKAGRLVIDTKKTPENVIRSQIKLRDNAIAQADLLKDYKRLFVHHPSHRRGKTTSSSLTNGSNTSRTSNVNTDDADDKGLLSIFVSLLVEPLSRTGSARTDHDHLTIELILHLFRNLLSAGDPLLKGTNALDKTYMSAVLHQELICLFDREMVLDIMLVIGQEMESRENKQYNLLIMEILHHMLKSQDPTLVARSVQAKPHEVTKKSTTESNRTSRTRINSSQQINKSNHLGMNSLRTQLQKERHKLHVANTSRHSYFGGTLVIPKSGGNQRVLSAAVTQGMASTPSLRGAIYLTPTTSRHLVAKRKSKKHQIFVGAGRTLATHTRPGAANASATHNAGPASQQAQRVIHSFCQKVMSQCYGPIMKSLKKEFQRDSNRLEHEDKVIFFRIIWFFCQWARVTVSDGGSTALGDESSQTAIGHLVFTMDFFTFNLVLAATDYYFEHKKYVYLAQTVALYTEMMNLLYTMYTSVDDTEKIMAMGLIDRLFYQTESMDRLPKLISRWTPGTYTREYICDLVELSYTTLKLLEANEKACVRLDGIHSKKGSRKKKNNEPLDAVAKMRDMAATFDVTSYFGRKIVSNQVALMFTQLLSLYDINAKHINDHIVSFFVRICKFVVVDEREDAEYFATSFGKSKPGATKVTLEPMLYNIPFLTVLNTVLNDVSLREEPDFYSVLSFATTIVKHYAKACSVNPMLHVETLFRHSLPHRFCTMSANLYVSEELQMITERDILLEQQDQVESGDEERDIHPEQQAQVESGKEDDAKSTTDVQSADEIGDIDHNEGAVRKTKKRKYREQELQMLSEKNNPDVNIERPKYPMSKRSKASDVILTHRSNILTTTQTDTNPMREGDDMTHHSEPSLTDMNSVKEIENGSNLIETASVKSTTSSVGGVRSVIVTDKNRDDERWNDRRKFVRKRKSMPQVIDNTRVKDVFDEQKVEPTNELKRIRRAVLDDSDEDEDFGISGISSGHLEGTNSSRLVLDEDEDNE